MAQNQATGEHPVARIYQALQTGEPLTTKQLLLGGIELRRLCARKEALHIRADSVLEIPLVINENGHRSVVCQPNPPPLYQEDSDLEDLWISTFWNEPHSGTTPTGLMLA